MARSGERRTGFVARAVEGKRAEDREDEGRTFEAVTALAAHPKQNVVIAGGKRGLYRSTDNGTSYEFSSSTVFPEKVRLPVPGCSSPANIR